MGDSANPKFRSHVGSSDRLRCSSYILAKQIALNCAYRAMSFRAVLRLGCDCGLSELSDHRNSMRLHREKALPSVAVLVKVNVLILKQVDRTHGRQILTTERSPAKLVYSYNSSLRPLSLLMSSPVQRATMASATPGSVCQTVHKLTNLKYELVLHWRCVP